MGIRCFLTGLLRRPLGRLGPAEAEPKRGLDIHWVDTEGGPPR